MSAVYPTVPLGQLCGFQRGLTYEKRDEVNHSPNIVLRANNIDSARNVLDLSDLRYISSRVHVPQEKIVRQGSLLICTASGSKSHLGKVAYIDREYGHAFGGFMGQLTPNRSIHGRYLFYALISTEYRAFIADLTDGTNINNLKFADLSRFRIALPQLRDQQRIVSILDNALESIATAKASTETNIVNIGEVYESELERAVAIPYTEKLTLQALIDRQWVTSHLDGNHGSDYPRKHEFIAGGVPYISANCLTGATVDLSKAKHLSTERAARIKKGVARDGDVLFAHNATVGPVALLSTEESKVILGTSLTYYRCDGRYILPEYLVHYMRSRGFVKQYMQVMRQSTRNQVPIIKQREFYHLVPPPAEQRRIAKTLGALRPRLDDLVL